MNEHDNVVEDFDCWLTFNFAAIVITRFFRELTYNSQYHVYYNSGINKRNAYRNHLSRTTNNLQRTSVSFNTSLSFALRPSPPHISSSSGNIDYYQSLLYQRGTIADKFQLWRNVIELKRVYIHYSNDLLMKALIESNGDVSKATILLENQSFLVTNLHNQAIQLNPSIKELFFPLYDEYEACISQQSMIRERRKNASLFPAFNGREEESLDGSRIANDLMKDKINTNLSVVRSLRMKHQQSTEKRTENEKLLRKKKDLLFHLMNVVERTYLPVSSSASSSSSSPATAPLTASGGRPSSAGISGKRLKKK
jgi:hypothetical protein